MRARVFVTLKPSVFDPQGKTIADALHTLGYGGVQDVRQGKYFELDLVTTEPAQARALDEQGRSADGLERSDRAVNAARENPNGAREQTR